MSVAGLGTEPRASSATNTRFWEGAREVLPMALGVLPLALAIGVALASSSVPALAGWLSGPAIFGGAAQLLTIQMIDDGAATAVIVVSALLVNARVVVYGAALAPWFAEATLRTRLLVAFPIIDPLFLLAQPRFERGDLDQRSRTAYYAGAAFTLVGVWMSVQAAALLVGGVVPEELQLSMAAPLVFAGYLAHVTRTRSAVVAAGTAAVVAVAGSGLPFQSALSAGVLAGLVAGWGAGRPPFVKESS